MIDVYTFYIADGGQQVARRWLASDRDAEDYARELCDDMGLPIEVARGEELQELATFEPDDWEGWGK